MYTEEQVLTPELKGKRTLAAIVFTDVVCYSTLMAANEEHTLDLLRRDFRVMKQLCQQFEGQVLKTIGDALLMYFPSAVKAVTCARAIQSNLAEAAANLPAPDILTHRIGVHLGDVYFNGSDVMGDGVNVAARLQSEAEPGGICLSQTVYEVVKNPLAIKATDLVPMVPKKLKNMPGAMPVYQIPPIYPTPYAEDWELEPAQSGQSVIHSSGQWILLNEQFFPVETYSHTASGQLTVQIPSRSIQDDTALSALRPSLGQSPLMKFAYQNDGFLVRVKQIEAISRNDCQIWTLTLQPETDKNRKLTPEQPQKVGKRTYSADEIAQLRARRLLLNDPPKLQMLGNAQLFTPAMAEREVLENILKGDGLTQSDACVLQALYPTYKDRPKVFLELARLQAIYYLKVGGIVDRILELSLGPIAQGKVHVRFRAKRRHVYVDVPPTPIEFEGDCPVFASDKGEQHWAEIH